MSLISLLPACTGRPITAKGYLAWKDVEWNSCMTHILISFFYRCRHLEEFKVNFVASYGKFRPSFVCKLLDQNFISGKSLIWSWAFIDPISWLFPLWMDWLAKTWLSQVICVRRGFMKWWHLIFPMFLVSVSSQLMLLFTWIFVTIYQTMKKECLFLRSLDWSWCLSTDG